MMDLDKITSLGAATEFGNEKLAKILIQTQKQGNQQRKPHKSRGMEQSLDVLKEALMSPKLEGQVSRFNI